MAQPLAHRFRITLFPASWFHGGFQHFLLRTNFQLILSIPATDCSSMVSSQPCACWPAASHKRLVPLTAMSPVERHDSIMEYQREGGSQSSRHAQKEREREGERPRRSVFRSCTFLSRRLLLRDGVQRHLKLPDCEADDLLARVGSPSKGVLSSISKMATRRWQWKTNDPVPVGTRREIVVLETMKAYSCSFLGVVAVYTLRNMLASLWPTSRSSEKWHENSGKCSSHCRPTAIGTRFMRLPSPGDLRFRRGLPARGVLIACYRAARPS